MIKSIIFIFGIVVIAFNVNAAKQVKQSAIAKKNDRTIAAHKGATTNPKELPFDSSMEWKSNLAFKHWLYDKEAIYNGPTRLKALALVKKLELEEKYEECTSQILKIWKRYPEFQNWLGQQGTQCLLNQLKTASPQNKNLYYQWWNHIVKKRDFTKSDIGSLEGIKEFYEYGSFIWKSDQFPKPFRSEVAEIWKHWVDTVSKKDSIEIVRLIAESLEEDGQLSWSKALLEREGLNGNQSLVVNNNVKKNLEKSLEKTNEKTSEKTTEKIAETTIKNSEEDLAYQGFQNAIKQNQLTGAAEKAVSYLDQFPNGIRAQYIQDKLFQTYFLFWDQSQVSEQKNSEYKTQIERCLEEVKLLHSTRLIEFSKQAHRRSDFKGAYLLSKQSLLGAEKSVEGASMLFIAGRSAYFIGLYRESIEFFDRLIQRHGGYVDIAEVKFRRAMAYIRLNDDYKAEEALAELWTDPENKTYGLSTLYWLIRIKQKRKAEADDLLRVMQDRFSLTYYGLKLNAEMNNQKIALQAEAGAITVQERWIWTPLEKKYWERAVELAKAGWYSAAQSEINNLPFNFNLNQKFLWIQQLVQFFAFPQAFRLYNELIDLDPKWRKAPFLKTVFPRPLEHIIIKEAQKNDLNPLLVLSLIRQESAFALSATSRSQAKGFMQLIPATANEVASELKIKKFDSDQMYHPITNIKFGSYYLSKVIRQFGGNVSVGLAAYNAGPQRVKKFFELRSETENYLILSQEDPWSDLWLEELPWLETNLYVKSILRNRIIYQLLEVGSMELPIPVWKDLYLGAKKF